MHLHHRAVPRRTFLRATLGAGGACLTGCAGQTPPPADDSPPARCRVRALTRGPKHHFFGYYGVPPWNRSGSRLVCLESDFQDHLPRPEERARICLIDAASGALSPVAETSAWNLQQGAMLHWNPLRPDDEILYNDRRDGQLVGVVLDVRTGRSRLLDRAVSAAARSGRWALSLTYGRLTRLRPVVGYVGLADPHAADPHPDADGVFLMDLETGRARLLIAIGEIYRRLAVRHPHLRDLPMWFNHTVFSPDAGRFFFLARCYEPQPRRRLQSAMFTANLDGGDLREAIPFGHGVSHFDWRNERELVATFRWPAAEGSIRHFLFTDGARDYREVGEGFLMGDGHCTFSPDGVWLASDPSGIRSRSLRILDVAGGRRMALGEFPLGAYSSGDLRCDLHPRWSRDGRAICFDAIVPADGTRQLHVAELEFNG